MSSTLSEYMRPNLSRIGWYNNHRNTKCPSGRACNDDRHFEIWKKRYRPQLNHLYSTFSRAMKPSKVSFSEFSEFAYLYSSGYISPYV